MFPFLADIQSLNISDESVANSRTGRTLGTQRLLLKTETVVKKGSTCFLIWISKQQRWKYLFISNISLVFTAMAVSSEAKNVFICFQGKDSIKSPLTFGMVNWSLMRGFLCFVLFFSNEQMTSTEVLVFLCALVTTNICCNWWIVLLKISTLTKYFALHVYSL